jgi:hypothetical protein
MSALRTVAHGLGCRLPRKAVSRELCFVVILRLFHLARTELRTGLLLGSSSRLLASRQEVHRCRWYD